MLLSSNEMLTVSTQRVFSNPVTTLPRLLNVFRDIAPLEVKNKKNPGKRDTLLLEAQEKASDARVRSSMEPYRLYENMLFQNISKMDGADLYVLNGVSPDRTPVNPYRWGVDIFHPMHFISEKLWLETVDKLLNIARRRRPSASLDDILGEHIVMSGQITDWPGITVEDDAGLKLRHPYIGDVRAIERSLGKKRNFGTLEKRLNDDVPKMGNSQYSEGVLSFQHFRQIRDAISDLDINLIEEMGGRELFYDYARQHIQLIREIVIGKTAEFLGKLQPENVYIHSMLTSSTADIWKRASESAGKELKLIGGDKGPLVNSDRTTLAEIDPSAIRLLEGLLMNNYYQRTGYRLEIPFRVTVPERPRIETFSHCPYGSPWDLCNIARYCSGPTSCLKSDEDKLEASDKEIIRHFALENKTGYLPIEGIIYLMNLRDNILGMDTKSFKSWTADTQGKTVVPLQLPQIPEVKEYDIRASELTYPMDTVDALTKTGEQIIAEEQKKLEDISVYLRRGTLIHDLGLGGDQTVYRNLLHPDFRLPRKEYCDQEGPERKHTVYNFLPNSSHFAAVEERLLKLGKRYDVSGMLELLAEIEGKPKIVVSGHPDAAAQLYSPDTRIEESPLTIIDLKTSMAISSERKNVTNQLLVYGMAIRQMLNRDTDTIYTIPVYTRFSSNRLLPQEKRDMTDYGQFHRQKPAPVKVLVGSERMQEMQNRLLELYVAKMHVGLIRN